MAIHYRTQGFILKKTDRGEADQILTIYTKDFGKLEILGKAIRKIKSKLRSGADLFYFSEIEFIQGKAYKTLTDAILIEKFKNLRNDLTRLEIVNQIAQVLDNLIRGQEKDDQVWNLLEEIFKKLNNLQLTTYNLQLVYHYFLWNFLSILGYQIDLYNCALCQKKLSPRKLSFKPQEGGIICFECHRKIKKGEKISPEVIKISRLFLKKDWDTLLRLKVDKDYKNSLELISQDYLSFYKQTVYSNN